MVSIERTSITNVELGVGTGYGDSLTLWKVPIEEEVQVELISTLLSTTDRWNEIEGLEHPFNPAERQASIDKLTWPNTEESCPTAYRCYQTGTLDSPPNLDETLRQIRFYFVRISSDTGQKVIGVKAATGFKRVTNAHGIVRLWDNSLHVVNDPIFLLEDSFDFIIEENTIRILHPKQFVYVCEMQKVIRAAAPANVAAISEHLPMFDFADISEISTKRSRVAAIVASIRNLELMLDLNVEKFTIRCMSAGVGFTEEDGKKKVCEKDVVAFLEILDCRRYATDHSNSGPVEWLASGRDKVRR